MRRIGSEIILLMNARNSMNNIAIKILLATVIIAAPFGAYSKDLTIGDYAMTFDQTFEADTDGNGTNDRTSYYQGDTLMWAAYDEDENGKADLWLRYKNGDSVDLELYDRDGDGEPDKIVEVDSQEKTEVIYDAAAKGASSPSSFAALIIALVLGGAAAGWYFWREKNGFSVFPGK